MKLVVSAAVVCVILLMLGCGGDRRQSTASLKVNSTVEAPTPSHPRPTRQLVPRRQRPHIALPQAPPPKRYIIVRDLKRGTGAVARTGDRITIDWVGVYYQSGRLIGSTWKDGPFTFWLGRREGERAFSHSLQGMRVGGRRELIVPAQLTSWYQLPSDRRSQIDVVDLRGIE
jgi:peptidylprolyl isomerase